MNNLVFVAGARPNFMKVAPILRALEQRGSPLGRTLVHTGQHYDPDMSEVFFEELGIARPDAHLEVGSGSHGAQTARVLEAFEAHLLGAAPRPRGVVVVGDVNSTLAATLAAVKLQIPVAHVEAGLRSRDRTMPEEINRVVTDALAELLLVSESDGLRNLQREGIDPARVHLVGNVMIDTLVRELPAARAADAPAQQGVAPGAYALVTLHRPANVDSAPELERLLRFLGETSRRLPVVFPAHPRTRARLAQFGLQQVLAGFPRVRVIPPQGYRSNLGLMASARLVITDSGGMQEETTYLGVPCLTFRPNTERPVTVTAGTSTLVGGDLQLAARLVEEILAGRYKQGGPVELWDGAAAERVADVLERAWG